MPAFTCREREVLSLLVSGLGNKAIGAELFISEATVKYHLRNIMDKLSVRRRTEVAAIALRMGVV
ncbi:response regulator transcription factor [Dietzia cinnamea]|nr:response regulator transcription factor [Dietzia cinnamea]